MCCIHVSGGGKILVWETYGNTRMTYRSTWTNDDTGGECTMSIWSSRSSTWRQSTGREAIGARRKVLTRIGGVH